jgi:hypothetical protein
VVVERERERERERKKEEEEQERRKKGGVITFSPINYQPLSTCPHELTHRL